MTVDLTDDEIGLIQKAIHTKQIYLYIEINKHDFNPIEDRRLKEYEEYKALNEKLDKVLEQNKE